MLQLLVLQLLAWACTSLLGASGSEAAVGGSFGSDGQGRQESQVLPWTTQQWWWLTDLLSLPHGQMDEMSARRAKTGQVMGSVGQEASAVSVLVPLDPPGDRHGARLVPLDPPRESPGTREEVRRLLKRPCRSGGRSACRRRTMAMMPFTEVWKGWRAEYLSVPEALVQLSQQQTAGDSVCEDLSVQLFTVDLRDHQIEPLWEGDSFYIGMCPSKLQTRSLGDNVWPPRVVESVCVCQQSTCSNLGGEFLCQAVRRPITIWLRRDNSYLPSHEMVSVGCFCGQRISRNGQYAEPALSS